MCDREHISQSKILASLLRTGKLILIKDNVYSNRMPEIVNASDGDEAISFAEKMN